jgi:SagB-type dehydrogenase family enzyme
VNSIRDDTGAAPGICCRRSPHLIAYWNNDSICFHNYATGARVGGTALTIGLLDFFSEWRDIDALLQTSTLPKETLASAIEDLVAAGFLHRADRQPDAREEALGAWESWNPATGFFHSATRDCNFEEGEQHADEFLRERAATRPQPGPTKDYPGAPKTALPAAECSGAFPAVLLERRTWRRFGPSALHAQALGTLLGLTFGVQQWADQQALGVAMLRTSPSAGARHPIEAYVVVRDVDGMAPGIYHYTPDTHELSQLHGGNVGERLAKYLPGQPFYTQAPAVVIMTAVFTRTEWQYPFPRAYRVVHLEAGHFCQTFCLVATWLGLAPFCTAALADSLIETDLGIDGVSESVLYACGVGTRPPGTAWAPWADARELPRVFPPKHKVPR